jgi:hypothetical protein
MKKLVLAATLAAFSSPAYADLVLFDNPFQSNAASANEQSLVDVGGIGFGARPRILTLQESPHQVGSSDPTSPTGRTGDAIGGDNKSDTPTLGALNWGGASQVAFGYDSNQNNNGITINALTLSLYNASNVFVDSFSIGGRIQYTAADLALQQGNGTGLFIFVLDAAQRAEWNALNPTSTYKIGLFADMGCGAAPCEPSNDGADSFIAIAGLTPIINPTCPDCTPTPQAVPGPIVGAGIPGLITACLTLIGLARHRRRRNAEV